MSQTKPLFGQEDVTDIISVLRKEKSVKYDRTKLPLTHVLIFQKGDVDHVVYVPAGDVTSSILTAYVAIRPITMNAKGCYLGERCSGLALMPFAYGGVKPAIEKYNKMSKDVGDYSLFGKITAIVSLTDDNITNFQ